MEYSESSFRNSIAGLFTASDDEEASRVASGIPVEDPDPLLLYLRQTLEVLESASLETLRSTDRPPDASGVDRGWIRIHNLYKARRYLAPAHMIIKRLYPFMRRYECDSHRWWHKGNPCWFMGLTSLQMNLLVEARVYFALAMVEDAIAHKCGNPTDASQLPAYAWLSNAVDYTPEQAAQLLASVTSAVSTPHPTEPERTYIRAICRLPHFMEEWGALPFLRASARALLDWALSVSGDPKGGEPLEVLTCYLVETTPGLRAAMRITGSDAENDLLVRSSHEAGPLSDFGRYLLGQCKNKKKDAVGAPVIREFLGRLAETGCTFGLFVTPTGITGRRTRKGIAADRVLLKAQQRTGITVSVLNRDDLDGLCDGKTTLAEILPMHYVSERFDLFRD